MKNEKEIVEELYRNQNVGAQKDQKDLCDIKKYQNLLDDVKAVLKDKKDVSFNELRTELYKRSGLAQAIQNLILEKKVAPGLVLSYGTNNFQETIVAGNKEEIIKKNESFIENKQEMEKDTIFDLASTSKLFTSLSIIKLVELNLINLNDYITKYAPQFKNLQGITIYDLLQFEPLETANRIDKANSMEEAEKFLLDVHKKENTYGKSPYNDFAPMVLKYAIEKITSMTYKDFLLNVLLKDLNLTDTFVDIPINKIEKVANSNYDGRYYKDNNFLIRENAILGVSTDDKARILGQPFGNLSGHAGLFSNAADLTKVAKALINNQIISQNNRDYMAKNKTGFSYYAPNGNLMHSQYFGFLCYSKNPNLIDSEVAKTLSGKSFASAGWSGTQQTIDPLNKINLTYLSNRSHNRMTFIDSTKKDKIITLSNGQRICLLPNGIEMIDATKYAYEKSEIINIALDLALKYKILEDLTNYRVKDENTIKIKKNK